ncbi:NAD(P)/FAD-dependent oxidoreductase [Roseibium sp.]|uniref:NAD(P)/FAD-dependent oxidoreductase n=1 Tax=Roseibium sp. TaxID=1936156 RepID=UPI003D0B3641
MNAHAAHEVRGTGYPGSYYAASANPAPERPALKGVVETEICVVGAGYSGLSAALHLAEKGYKVVVLEGAKVGWGASGRNGGQIVNGLNAGLDVIESRYGAEAAGHVGRMLQEGAKIIRERVEKYDIQCDLKDKNLFTAYNARHMKAFEAKQALWRRHGMDDHEMLDREALRRHIESDAYAGGMMDHSGGHMHPLNLALGEAAAFEKNGGVIHEQTRVVSVDQSGPQPVVHTGNGEVRAKTVLLCGNAYLGYAVPELEKRVMPVSTQVMATEPLGEERAKALLPTDVCVEDARYILDYFRLSADKRLLFGGGTVYGGADPKDIKAKLLPNMEKVFPQLKGVRIDHAWSGNFALSFSRVPQLGRLGSNVYFAHGYSGHGVTGSHLFGRILSEAVDGDLSRFDVFEKLPYLPFPGGRTFRVPYSVIGSWWYGLRDRLGV